MKIPKYLSPTALCEAQNTVIASAPKGAAALTAIRKLSRFWPALLFLPVRGNIHIRQRLILCALDLETDGMFDHCDHYYTALKAMKAMVNGPYIEGFSYLLYVREAYKFLQLYSGSYKEWDDIFEEQIELHRVMALPDGLVPTTDTRQSDKVIPSSWEISHTAAFTVCRRGGQFMLVWHDARVRAFRWRFNLHVQNTYGRVVRTGMDWEWYTGWPDKKVKLWWRIFAPRMKVLAWSVNHVVLRIGFRRKTILLPIE